MLSTSLPTNCSFFKAVQRTKMISVSFSGDDKLILAMVSFWQSLTSLCGIASGRTPVTPDNQHLVNTVEYHSEEETMFAIPLPHRPNTCDSYKVQKGQIRERDTNVVYGADIININNYASCHLPLDLKKGKKKVLDYRTKT